MHTVFPLPQENPAFRDSVIVNTIKGTNSIEMCTWLQQTFSFTSWMLYGFQPTLLIQACTCRIDICNWVYGVTPEQVNEHCYDIFRNAFRNAFLLGCMWIETICHLDPIEVCKSVCCIWNYYTNRLNEMCKICRWIFRTYGLKSNEDLHIYINMDIDSDEEEEEKKEEMNMREYLSFYL